MNDKFLFNILITSNYKKKIKPIRFFFLMQNSIIYFGAAVEILSAEVVL